MPRVCRRLRPLPVLVLAAAAAAQPMLVQKTALTLDAARRIAAGAEAEAIRQHATVVIAVVDDGGHLLLLERLDDTQVASVDVAIGKARTAAIFRRPSADFEQQIANGRQATLVLPGATPLQGGVPIVIGGKCIGAIGVSGNTPQQDEALAIAGAKVAATFTSTEGSAAAADASTSPRGPRAVAARPVATTIVRLDPGLDAVLPADAQLEQIGAGFVFTEGPVWSGRGLLFSDPNQNTIFAWESGGALSVFRERSGYDGADIADYAQPGSNGLTIDRDGRLTACQHGHRRIVRCERDGTTTVLADRFDGKRLNSPNDLVYGADGSLYFTDPPFGLPKVYDDPRRELPFSGVFVVRDGGVRLLTSELRGPNGIALSPDERWLYVGNWDPAHKVVMRYPLRGDGSAGTGEVFADFTGDPGEPAIDGVKVDVAGNVYVAGPGGVWIVSAQGVRLGRIADRPEEPHNLAFGGDDGRTLYVTAKTGVYRMRTLVAGVHPSAALAR